MVTSPNKLFLYDWLGANDQIFLALNSIHGTTYDKVMSLLSQIADYKNFPYYLGAIFAWAVVSTLVRKMTSKGGVKYYFHMWIGVIIVLGFSFVVETLAVQYIKAELSYPRPYLVHATTEITVLEYKYEPENDYHSFPSGHAAFITLMIAGLWPVFGAGMRWAGTLLIATVCLSRISMGLHFPADVLGGTLLALVIVVLLRYVLYKLLLKMHIKC